MPRQEGGVHPIAIGNSRIAPNGGHASGAMPFGYGPPCGFIRWVTPQCGQPTLRRTVGRIWTSPKCKGNIEGDGFSEASRLTALRRQPSVRRRVIHGRPADCAPLWQAGGRAAVDNSWHSAQRSIERPSRLGFGIRIEPKLRGWRERIERLATRCDCARISDLFVEGGASWP